MLCAVSDTCTQAVLTREYENDVAKPVEDLRLAQLGVVLVDEVLHSLAEHQRARVAALALGRWRALLRAAG